MPDLTGSITSALGTLGISTGAPLGQALKKVEDAAKGSLGDNFQGKFDQMLQADPNKLRPDKAVAETAFTGPAGQVAALGQTIQEAVASRLGATEAAQVESRKSVEALLTGQDVDLHTVVLAADRAQLELQLTMQLRNKVLEAYQEVMRMPV